MSGWGWATRLRNDRCTMTAGGHPMQGGVQTAVWEPGPRCPGGATESRGKGRSGRRRVGSAGGEVEGVPGGGFGGAGCSRGCSLCSNYRIPSMLMALIISAPVAAHPGLQSGSVGSLSRA